MDQCGVVPSSDCDCDEDEDFNLLTVINEHSEVVGLIKDDRDNNSQIGQNGVINSNEIEIFHPTPHHQIILNIIPMKLIPLMIIQMKMEMNLTLVKIILVVRLMKMTVTVKIRNITWFTKKKIMALRIIFISLKYQSSIMLVMLNTKKILEMFGNVLKKIQGHLVDHLSVRQDYS